MYVMYRYLPVSRVILGTYVDRTPGSKLLTNGTVGIEKHGTYGIVIY
jgi:hypothetical protein